MKLPQALSGASVNISLQGKTLDIANVAQYSITGTHQSWRRMLSTRPIPSRIRIADNQRFWHGQPHPHLRSNNPANRHLRGRGLMTQAAYEAYVKGEPKEDKLADCTFLRLSSTCREHRKCYCPSICFEFTRQNFFIRMLYGLELAVKHSEQDRTKPQTTQMALTAPRWHLLPRSLLPQSIADFGGEEREVYKELHRLCRQTQVVHKLPALLDLSCMSRS